MKVLFKNQTALCKNNYMDLVKFHNKKNNLKYNLYTALISIMFIFAITFQVWQKTYITLILVIIFWMGFLFYRFLYPYYKTNKELQSDKVKKELVNTYIFHEDYFFIKNFQENVKLKYSKIYKVYENKKDFYLYLDKENALIVAKDGFIIGDTLTFKKFIKAKVKLKFK